MTHDTVISNLLISIPNRRQDVISTYFGGWGGGFEFFFMPPFNTIMIFTPSCCHSFEVSIITVACQPLDRIVVQLESLRHAAGTGVCVHCSDVLMKVAGVCPSCVDSVESHPGVSG